MRFVTFLGRESRDSQTKSIPNSNDSVEGVEGMQHRAFSGILRWSDMSSQTCLLCSDRRNHVDPATLADITDITPRRKLASAPHLVVTGVFMQALKCFDWDDAKLPALPIQRSHHGQGSSLRGRTTGEWLSCYRKLAEPGAFACDYRLSIQASADRNGVRTKQEH